MVANLRRGAKSHREHLGPPTIFGLADLRLQSECGGVSTFRKARRYSRATPNQSSTLSLSNSATALTSLLQAGQTFQQATQVQPLGLCPNQGWPRHSSGKLANTQQNPAFAQFSIQWVAATPARQLWINLKLQSRIGLAIPPWLLACAGKVIE
jgi:hypothetical protein